MNLVFESKFSPLLTGFRKNHSTKNALLNMIKKWIHALDKSKKVGIIFMDLSKAFDALNHKLLWLLFQCNRICSKLFSERFQSKYK